KGCDILSVAGGARVEDADALPIYGGGEDPVRPLHGFAVGGREKEFLMAAETLLRPSVSARNRTVAKLSQDRELANQKCRKEEPTDPIADCGLRIADCGGSLIVTSKFPQSEIRNLQSETAIDL